MTYLKVDLPRTDCFRSASACFGAHSPMQNFRLQGFIFSGLAIMKERLTRPGACTCSFVRSRHPPSSPSLCTPRAQETLSCSLCLSHDPNFAAKLVTVAFSETTTAALGNTPVWRPSFVCSFLDSGFLYGTAGQGTMRQKISILTECWGRLTDAW